MTESPDSHDSPAETKAQPAWSSEPFRAFFPLGIGASIIGVLVWPLFYWGAWNSTPLLQHPRIMIFGFGAAFVAGFLGTAWPRMVEAAPMKRWELSLLVITWIGAQVCYINYLLRIGDAFFAVHAFLLLAFLIDRALRGEDRPPPPFLLGGVGVALGFGVALIWAVTNSQLSAWTTMMTRLLAWQGMLLLPLLGVGSFFFPRFFPATDPPARRAKIVGIYLSAALILISLAIEASGWIRSGNLLRFAAVITWARLACPSIWTGRAPSTRAWALRLALGGVALTFLTRGIWPGPGHAIEHLLFLGGFGFALLLVADRVTLGHADELPAMTATSKRWRWLAWLLLLTAATRVSADMKMSLIVSHHIYAGLMWAGIAIAWAVPLLRHWGKNPTP